MEKLQNRPKSRRIRGSKFLSDPLNLNGPTNVTLEIYIVRLSRPAGDMLRKIFGPVTLLSATDRPLWYSPQVQHWTGYYIRARCNFLHLIVGLCSRCLYENVR